MAFSEWLLKTYDIKVSKYQMALPSHFIEYKKYCEENDVEEDFYN